MTRVFWIFFLAFVLFCMTMANVACSSIKLSDFKAHITLPASGDGYYVKTVTDEEGTIPKAQWEKMRARGIVLMPEDWAILKKDTLSNCLKHECKELVGVLDELFYSLDAALKEVNKLKK